jgi:hypothetical protein
MARTAQNSSHKAIENYLLAVETQGGILTNYPVQINNTLTTTGNTSIGGNLTVTGTSKSTGAITLGVITNVHSAPVAINSTGSATAAQVASGYITSTSAASTTITLPTATLLAAALGAAQGTVFDLFIDNTAGANTVTITPDSSMTKSQVAQVATYGVPTFGLFTVASGATGQAQFRLAFSSTTAATIARVF